jgi:hypothetical protein
MYNSIAPLVVAYVIHEVWKMKEEKIQQAWTTAIRELAKAREIRTLKAKNTPPRSGSL